MNPALVRLLKLRFRGRLRQMLRGLKTPRGAVFFGIGVIIFVIWLGPTVAMAAFHRPNFDPQTVRTMIPLALLALCLLNVLASAKQRGIAFSEAEIDVLFAGPFTRRELLLYKISVGTAGSVFGAFFFSLVFAQYARFWLAAFVGWPLPTSFPDGDAMSRALRTSVSDEVVINTLAAIAWRTWRQLVLGLAAEAAGVVRGRERPRLPVMPVVQVLAPSSPACCSSVRRCTRHGRPWQRHRCLPRSLYFSL